MISQQLSSLFRARCGLLRPRYSSSKTLAATEQDEHRVKVESVENGFIVDEVRVEGAVVAHGPFWMMWKAENAAAITSKHLAILQLIRPAPELIIIGCGERHELLSKDTMSWLRSTGTSVEVLPTERAIEYFNILNQERRSVIAALLPY